MAGCFGDFIITRCFTETFSCVSVRFSPLPELDAPGISFVSTGSPCNSSFSSCSAVGSLLILGCFFLVVHEEEREVQPQAGCPQWSSSASVVFDTARRFSSDQLCSASRRTLRAYTTPSSVLTRCSSVRSLVPSHTADFHLSDSFGAGFPDPFPTSGR